MDHRDPACSVGRRDFIKGAAALATAATVSAAVAAEHSSSKPCKTIGIQIGAVSFVDEGVDQVLDIVQDAGRSIRSTSPRSPTAAASPGGKCPVSRCPIMENNSTTKTRSMAATMRLRMPSSTRRPR